MGLEHRRGSGERVAPAGASQDGATGGCQLRRSMTWKGRGEQLGRKQKGRWCSQGHEEKLLLTMIFFFFLS